MSSKVPQRIVIVGATSAIAVETARALAKSIRRDFVLLGRDASRLEAVAADLRTRSGRSTVEVREVAMTDASAIRRAAEEIAAAGAVDAVLVAHGSLIPQEHAQQDLALAEQSILVNAVSPALFAEAFASVLEKQGAGHLTVIGSVAGDRGRKSNYVYGASKGFLERFLQGLAHRLAPTEVGVLLVKPGPTDTPMTADLKASGQKLASRQAVGAKIAKAIGRKSGVIYAPGLWRVIMGVIRRLPRFVFHKMDI